MCPRCPVMKTSLSLVLHLSLGIFSVLLFIAFCSFLYYYGPALGKLLNRKDATQNKYSEKGYRDVNFNTSGLDGANISTSKTVISVHSQKLSNLFCIFLFQANIAQLPVRGQTGKQCLHHHCCQVW